MYSGNKNIKNTFLIKRYFATYVAFSSSIKIENTVNTLIRLAHPRGRDSQGSGNIFSTLCSEASPEL